MIQATYQDIRKTVSTGDILLFSGRGRISVGIRLATRSRWSHVGMAVILQDYDFVCLWESTTGAAMPDLDTGIVRSGVQLVPLSSRLDAYEGDVSIRHLEGVVFDDADVAGLMRLRRDLRTRPYERHFADLVQAAYDGPLGDREEDLSSLFCSELVAEAYQTLGLIDPRRASDEYVPADFSTSRERLPWLRGALGPEIPVKVVSCKLKAS
jgi:hypothetical protein